MLRLYLDELWSAQQTWAVVEHVRRQPTHGHSQPRVVERVPNERPSRAVDVRVLFPENEGHFALALQIAVLHFEQGVVGLSFTERCRVNARVSRCAVVADRAGDVTMG